MIGKLLGGGGGGGGLLGGLMEKLNPMKMLEQLKQLPEQLLGGVLGGGDKAGGAKGGGKAKGAEDASESDETNPLSAIAQMDPTGLLKGLVGAVGERGLS